MQVTGRRTRLLLSLCLLGVVSATGQDNDPANLTTTGQIAVDGREVSYLIRHLPPSSFPDLPMSIAASLAQRGCLIPQTYEAHHPENVVHGSFERAGSSDWAVLCTVRGEVSLLVFFANGPEPVTLATAAETQRLQSHPSSPVLGFNWGIDSASPQAIHTAQIGLSPRPPRLDHDAIADSIVDRKTIYRYHAGASWSLVDLPD
jgi:hypothetical protein